MSDTNKSDAKNFAVVNHSVPRRDGVAKVTGSATYASDITLERMAWAKLLRSPFAHAKIISIDFSEARRLPGVIDVLTGNDLGPLHPYYGHAVGARDGMIHDGKILCLVFLRVTHRFVSFASRVVVIPQRLA